MEFLSQLINGLSLGSIYALIALGYTMVYGICKMLNFAHGDVIMVGAYMLSIAMATLHFPPFLSILVSMVVCATLGVCIEKIAYKPLRNASPLAVLITAIGVSYFLQSSALLLFGSTQRRVESAINVPNLQIGAFSISGNSLITLGVTVVLMVIITWFINNTMTGKAMLAVSPSPY